MFVSKKVYYCARWSLNRGVRSSKMLMKPSAMFGGGGLGGGRTGSVCSEKKKTPKSTYLMYTAYVGCFMK